MKKCRLNTRCSDCPHNKECPRTVRRDKLARRPMALAASKGLMRRAAKVLSRGWYTCRALGAELYGGDRTEKKSRMSMMVRARRPINRLREMGLLVTRQNSDGYAEHTILPEGLEVLGC